jgi:hypothetical protein
MVVKSLSNCGFLSVWECADADEALDRHERGMTAHQLVAFQGLDLKAIPLC